MAERQKLSEAEVRARLPEVPGWELVDGKLHKAFRFASFVQAFGCIIVSLLTSTLMTLGVSVR